MIFLNADGRNATVSVIDPDPGLEALEVETVMDSILSYNVFNTSGGDMVSKVRSQIVSRTVDVLGEY
jgi:hypothetical protein